MITDPEACSLVAASYTAVPTIQVSDVRLVITRQPAMTIVAIPGTREDVLADWIRDLSAMPHESRTHPRLGECHDGCLSGAESVLDAALNALDDVYLYDIDSLEQIVRQSLEVRRAEVVRCEKMIDQHVGEYVGWMRNHIAFLT